MENRVLIIVFFCICFDHICIGIFFLVSYIIKEMYLQHIERLLSLLFIFMSSLFPWTPLFPITATCYFSTSRRWNL